MNKQDCKEEGLALSDDDDHDLIMSSSAKEIVGAIAECRWDLMSLDEKKKHIKSYNPNIPNVEFFDALNDNELNEVMSDFTHHTGMDCKIEETYITTKFLKFSYRRYENKYRAFASQIALSSDEETFTIELNLKPVGGRFYTIEPNERDTYEADINNLDKPISILVSSSDGKYRTVSVAVGDRAKLYTLENNEYMGGFISEVIEFMCDGIIGKQLRKVRKMKKDSVSEELEKNCDLADHCDTGEKQGRSRDKRLPKQFGDFAEGLVMYVLGKLNNMSVALIDHVGADIIASDRAERRYAISVKGRNIPDTESKGFSFEKRDMEKLEETASYFGLESAVAFVLVDTVEKSMKIRILIATLNDLKNHAKDMSKSDFLHINPKTDAIEIKYGRDKHLKQMKDCDFIDYTEFELKPKNNTFPPS